MEAIGSVLNLEETISTLVTTEKTQELGHTNFLETSAISQKLGLKVLLVTGSDLQQGQLQVFHVPPALVLIKSPSMWHQRLCMMASNNLNLTSMSE